jgi:HEXXH motif-containing protein
VHVDSLKLANALVHEAIHSLLYMVELMEPFYVFEDRAFEVASPWTGNLLSLRSYVHACFVWFGLWNFWRAAIGSDALTGDEACGYVLRPSSGFKNGAFGETAAVLRRYVKPQLFEAIQVMQDTVTGSH